MMRDLAVARSMSGSNASSACTMRCLVGTVLEVAARRPLAVARLEPEPDPDPDTICFPGFFAGFDVARTALPALRRRPAALGIVRCTKPRPGVGDRGTSHARTRTTTDWDMAVSADLAAAVGVATVATAVRRRLAVAGRYAVLRELRGAGALLDDLPPEPRLKAVELLDAAAVGGASEDGGAALAEAFCLRAMLDKAAARSAARADDSSSSSSSSSLPLSFPPSWPLSWPRRLPWLWLWLWRLPVLVAACCCGCGERDGCFPMDRSAICRSAVTSLSS